MNRPSVRVGEQLFIGLAIGITHTLLTKEISMEMVTPTGIEPVFQP